MKNSPILFLTLALSLLISILMQGCVTPSAVRPPAGDDWVEESLRKMQLREKISQMIMARAYGYYYSDQSGEFERLSRLVREDKVGGLIFFQGDVYETATLINRLQEASGIPLLIGSDFEWGTAMRIRRGTRFPEAMALGATRDSALVFRIGEAVGKESRAIGVHQVFAPVADVNNNPDNPVINTRSFGEDQRLVARMASAFAAGLGAGGAVATAKHFPGHGDTRVDSHLDLPLINHDRSRLDSVELYPFRVLVDRKVPSVMVAHLEVPALEEQQLPATLSPAIVTGVLRNEIGFTGLIVTDALDMGAVVNRYGPESAAVRAVISGADILVVPPDESRAIGAVESAVREGKIEESRIDGSVRKILECKRSLNLHRNRLTDLKKLPEIVASEGHLALAKQAARKSVTVLKNCSIIPVAPDAGEKIVQITVTDADNYRTEIHRSSSPYPNEPAGDYFAAQLRKRGVNLQTVRISPSSDSLDFNRMFRLAAGADLIIIPVFARARSGSAASGLGAATALAIDSLTRLKPRTILAAMGTPYLAGTFPYAAASLCAYSDCEVSTEAAVEAIFGEIPAEGKIPVTIAGGIFPRDAGLTISQSVLRKEIPEYVGMDGDSLGRLDSLISEGIGDRAFPGAQLLVSKDGAVVYNKSFGSFEYSPGSKKVDASTLYDLASVTKVIATTAAVMSLLDAGKISPEEPVVTYIPEFGNRGKEAITVKNLLLHDGGLPAFKRLYLNCNSPAEILDSICQTETLCRPGDSTVYSDFDFILLGKIVEKVSGLGLDRYLDSAFFRPLGMRSTMFNPSVAGRRNVAPTEYDSLYRRRLVQAEVHDENAFALGGVAGHAGLFSNASDLAVFLQMILNGGGYGGRQYLNPETVRLFTTRHSVISTRALGWDTKTMNGYSSAGSLFGGKSFGHTGFTGTSVWIEPEKNIFVILLTNRVYPTRNNSKIAQIRPKVHDAVIRAVR